MSTENKETEQEQQQNDSNNNDINNKGLNFQCKLPEVHHSDKELEDNIIKFLSDNGDYYKHWGDPILIILRSDWNKEVWKDDDEYEMVNGKKIIIKKGATHTYYFLEVSCICFNDEPKFDEHTNQHKKYCYLTSFSIRCNENGPKNMSNWEDWISLKYDAFDPRQLDKVYQNKIIEKYGEELYKKSFLESSNISNDEQNLINAMQEIRRLHSKGLEGRKQKEFVDAAKKAVNNGANPNLIIDEDEYRVLHYARWLNGSDYLLDFIKFMREKGADNQLGPIQKTQVSGGNGNYVETYLVTPWYFYQLENIMLKNGPLHQAIGGKAGGLIHSTQSCCIIL